MKKNNLSYLVILFTFILFILSLSSVKVQAADYSAYWNFNEGSGYIVNTPVGTATNTLWVNGGIGGTALGFDGKTSYVTSELGETICTPPFSVEAWILPDKNLRSAGIISKYANHGSRCFDLFFENAVLAFSVGDDSPSWSGWRNIARSAKDVLDGKFHHVVATYDLSSIKIYVDGIKVSEVTESRNINKYGPPVCIGNDRHDCVHGGGWGEQPNYYKGLVDEVKIYPKALSEAEISQGYNAKKDNVVQVDCFLEGEKRCDDKKVEACEANSWKVLQACDVNCTTKEGQPICQECKAFSKRCYDGNIQSCSYGGFWQDYYECNNGCEIVDGGAECKESSNSKNLNLNTGSKTNTANPISSILGPAGAAMIIIWVIVIIISLVSTILWIICLVNVLKSGNDSGWKVLWIVLITILGIVGIILYFAIGKKSRISTESAPVQASSSQNTGNNSSETPHAVPKPKK